MARAIDQPRANAAVLRSRARRGRLGISHIAILFLVLLGSIATGYFGYYRFAPTKAPSVQPTTSPVRRGTITASVNLSGSTAAMSQAKLTFETSGRLTKLLVKAGDRVKEGDVLAKVDTADLSLQVAQAEVSLEQARLKLADLRAGPKPADVAAAEAAIRDAGVAVANAQDSQILTNKSTTVGKDIRDRQNEYNWYLVHYGETKKKFDERQTTQEDLNAAYAAFLLAQERLDSAKLQADLAVRKADNDVQKAQDSLNKSKSQLETLTAGTAATDIATQEVTVRLAEATLKQRQLSLQKATLTAPFDGIVDSITANVGEQVSTSKEVLAIVNMQRFRIDARVDETDVSRLAVGQTANVAIDALPGARLIARVASVAANPVTSQGVVNYPVVLELDPTEAAVRPGMTASVAVESARRENVLLVPNRAIRTLGRNRTVEVMTVDGYTETRTVTVGMSNDQSTEILEGLQEGDVVVIPTTTTAATNVPRTGGLGGIPGMPGGMPGGFGR